VLKKLPVRVALAAAVAACALPAVAQAATVQTSSDQTRLTYRGAGGENNSLNIPMFSANAVEIKDFAGLTESSPVCSQISTSTVRCAGIRFIDAFLGDRNDSTSIRTPIPVSVEGGAGDDSFIAGASPTGTQVDYRGNLGFDRMSYTPATTGVKMTNDNFNNDGRLGLDLDDIGSDIERLIGSRHNDSIGDAGQQCCGVELSGGLGNDLLLGSPRVGASTTFDMGPVADGADTITPGANLTFVDYGARTKPVNVTVGFRNRDDGEAGEGDDIRYEGGAILVDGGPAADTLSSFGAVLDGQNVSLRGNGGGDRLEGGAGAEFFDGGPGVDTFIANGGNDSVDAIDGESDIVGCGSGTDVASVDSSDVFSSCESRFVGVLRMAPKAVRAKAGKPARIALSWRHPRDWKQLKTIKLRLTRRGAPVGEVVIGPRDERISAAGGVRLVRRATRLRHRGKTVSVRLALRLDPSLAGRTLKAEVEATDVRGRRQIAN
jgi:hypothetical protein